MSVERKPRDTEAFVEQAAHYFARAVHAAPSGVPLTQLRTKAGTYRPVFVKAMARAVRAEMIELELNRALPGPVAPRPATRLPRGNADLGAIIRAELAGTE